MLDDFRIERVIRDGGDPVVLGLVADATEGERVPLVLGLQARELRRSGDEHPAAGMPLRPPQVLHDAP